MERFRSPGTVCAAHGCGVDPNGVRHDFRTGPGSQLSIVEVICQDCKADSTHKVRKASLTIRRGCLLATGPEYSRHL
jgi:hypothetical protein